MIRARKVIFGDYHCPLCPCHFFNNMDFNKHVETHWKLTRDKKGSIMDVKANPVLASRISVVGTLVENGHRYSLIARGKLIYRKPEIVRY